MKKHGVYHKSADLWLYIIIWFHPKMVSRDTTVSCVTGDSDRSSSFTCVSSRQEWQYGEDLFFCRSPVFGRKKRLNFRFRPKDPSQFQKDFFFLEITPVFGRKKRLNF